MSQLKKSFEKTMALVFSGLIRSVILPDKSMSLVAIRRYSCFHLPSLDLVQNASKGEKMHSLLKSTTILMALIFGFSSAAVAQHAEHSDWLTKIEIQQLVDDYAIYRDRFDPEGYASVFAEDGEFLFRGQTYKGREALADRVRAENPNVRTMHVMTSGQIVLLDENNAEGIHYASIYSEPVDPTLPEGALIPVSNFAVMGIYTDTYVRTDEGWKIATRYITPVFTAAE